ncbi:MAG: hypothetical protein IPJ81_06250 [Chitinophagaceae bacterium]|nr:hypothetical protein [Chitinophagaceae bacterium]
MQIQKIIDSNNNTLGVFIPLKEWEEIKRLLPKTKPVDTKGEPEKLEAALSEFSFFQLSESSNSVLADLSAYYSRLIAQESEKPTPDQSKIDAWRKETDNLNALKRDHKTFETEDSMKDIIRTYSPLLKKAS